MEEHLDMDKLESYFGGENTVGFNYEAYAKKMKEDNISMYDVFYSCCSSSPGFLSSEINESVQSGTDDSEDEASIDRTVFSNLEEDDDSTHMGRCLAPNMNPIRLMNQKRHEELNQKRTRHLAGLTILYYSFKFYTSTELQPVCTIGLNFESDI
ncbi:hypothetical protein AAZX31_08G228100 [Glycine max]